MRFGGVQAVNHVNFQLRERELRCLIGPNGAGKSTFFKCLTGQFKLDESNGSVRILGQDVIGWRSHQIVRLGVGIKTQVPSVMNGLTVSENLWLASRRVSRWRDAGVGIDEAVGELKLAPVLNRQVGELAHGQRQLVEIGLVLVQRPIIVLLDEPAAGITGSEVERLVEVIKQLNKKAAVIVVDHDMEFVRMLGSKVTVFHQGAVLTEGPAEQVLADPKVREVYVGTKVR